MKNKKMKIMLLIIIVIVVIIGVKSYVTLNDLKAEQYLTSDDLYLDFDDYLDIISSYDVEISYYTPSNQNSNFVIHDAIESYKSILINLKSGKMYKIEGESGGIDGRNVVTSSKVEKLSQQQVKEISSLFDMTSDDSIDKTSESFWIVSFEDFRVNPTIHLKELPFDEDKICGNFINVNN